MCAQLQICLQRAGVSLTKTRGHIFGIGREFSGQLTKVMSVTAQNVPRPTLLDARRAWRKARKALPAELVDDEQWEAMFQQCMGIRAPQYTPQERAWVTS